MVMERTKLIAARRKAKLSQSELAERIKASREAVSQWERAIANPQPAHVRALCDVLQVDDADELLEIHSDQDTQGLKEEVALMMTPTIWIPPQTIHLAVASNPTSRFWQIAHTDYDTSDEMTADIRAAIKDMKTMNTGDEITRRDVLCNLAAIPIVALGAKHTLHARRYEEMLRYCTAALEACWELYRGSDPVGTQYAFDCVSTYVPMLETIAHDSPALRMQALDLAARYALLHTLLGWEHAKPWNLVSYAQNALSLSKESGDILLQLSACTKLCWAYLTANKPIEAWKTMQEGEHLLKSYQRKKSSTPLPSGIVGNFYSGYAVAQVDNGINPDAALGVAVDSEPLNGHIAFVEYTTSSQWLEAARVCSAKGDFKQAIVWVGKRIDLETLAPCVPQSKRGQIHAINILTTSLLQSQERDMGHIIRVWKAGMEGAHALRHEGRYQDAVTNFAIMRNLWRGEQAIRQLVPLTSHW
jgi:transcriptional regulator with XRE-family HTH domain